MGKPAEIDNRPLIDGTAEPSVRGPAGAPPQNDQVISVVRPLLRPGPRLVTNLERFPPQWQAPSGEGGVARQARTFGQFLRELPRAGWVLLNGEPELLFRLLAATALVPALRRPIVSVDLVLRVPSDELQRSVKRRLLSQVDFFLHFFKDLSGYERHYGIGPERSAYVPFKPNIRDRLPAEVATAPAGDVGRYVLCFGRSLRDYETFFDAMERLPFPAAIPRPDLAALRAHGSRFDRPLWRLPLNVTLLDDDGSTDAMIRMIGDARLVVLPILCSSLCASGVGSYLNAMLMHKCVVISDGPGASDVLTDQALRVPPEDAVALGATIRRAMEDDELRTRTAEAGYRYALTLGGEADSHRRIVAAALAGLRSRGQLREW